MKRILYGVLAGFSSVLYLYTLTAAAAPPDRARGRAVGQNKSAGNDGSNGATVSGPYDPYGVGDPSGNGSDNGDANGKPCAGCVGNADSKIHLGSSLGQMMTITAMSVMAIRALRRVTRRIRSADPPPLRRQRHRLQSLHRLQCR